jgi:hypothetical protein
MANKITNAVGAVFRWTYLYPAAALCITTGVLAGAAAAYVVHKEMETMSDAALDGFEFTTAFDAGASGSWQVVMKETRKISDSIYNPNPNSVARSIVSLLPYAYGIPAAATGWICGGLGGLAGFGEESLKNDWNQRPFRRISEASPQRPSYGNVQLTNAQFDGRLGKLDAKGLGLR